MEPISIAAATLVAKWFVEGFGKEAAGATIQGLKKVYNLVRSKLTEDKELTSVLDRLGEKACQRRARNGARRSAGRVY